MKNLIRYILSKIQKKSRISTIIDSSIHSTSKVEANSNIVFTNMDKHSFCGYNCDINQCEIGSFVSIANDVKIGGGMHPINWVGMSPVFYSGRDSVKMKFSVFEREKQKKTIIGHDVWIGQNVIIKQGVTIGNGAIVGMGSIVTKDVPPYAIYAGNPARLLRFRFEKETIDRLLEIQWWSLDETVLKKLAIHIKNPKKFIEEYDNWKEEKNRIVL